ncbi:alpha/beta fold hydrolase [Aureimonas psammosilenae]|uniref:alpha/beta fold hydrolase n=1 Tax=Aureimonas psammosilenae TaxID=2495496 RepID=UPI001260788A|nr:alpha/beta fold hydrolase [Aureimonas psammosilenae]
MILSEYVIPGMRIRDHRVAVPLDWQRPENGRQIHVFAREVVNPMRDSEAALPKLLFLQGGPGGKSPRPAGGPPWLKEALKSHRVILLDQRGTGRSCPIAGVDMAGFENGEEAADHLSLFRADSIVRDAEHLRKTVFGNTKWETLGQSYGGFVTITYLSFAPEGLAACYVTGGLPGLSASAEDVYRRTFPRAREKTRAFYERYPDDRARIGRVADFIAANDVRLPNGDRLTVPRLQIVGIDLGMGPGFENVHWLFDEAFADAGETRLSDHFLAEVARLTSYDGNPLYTVMQESIYGQGEGATAWAACRVLAEHPDFAPDHRPLLLPGEMIYPWMFRDIRSLRAFEAAAEALAAKPRHDPLYNADRLAANEVPLAAAVYFDDLYVDAGLSLETAAGIGNAQVWVTNEYEHDGVRASPHVFARLRDMVRERGGPLPPHIPDYSFGRQPSSDAV